MHVAFLAIMSEDNLFWNGTCFHASFRNAMKWDEDDFDAFEHEFLRVADMNLHRCECNMVIVSFENYIPGEICTAKIMPFIKKE